MNLKKNARAKAGAVIASMAALLVGWGLVHQNPPVPVAADTASTTDAAPAQNNTAIRATTQQNGGARATAPMPPKMHVRTHVS